MTFITWIRSSLEGKDNRSSARALTSWWYVVLNTLLTFAIVYLVYVVVLADKVNNEAVSAIWALLWLIVIYNATVLVIYQLVTAQNITEFTRAFRGNTEPIKVTTNTETKIESNNEETNNSTSSRSDIG